MTNKNGIKKWNLERKERRRIYTAKIFKILDNEKNHYAVVYWSFKNNLNSTSYFKVHLIKTKYQNSALYFQAVASTFGLPALKLQVTSTFGLPALKLQVASTFGLTALKLQVTSSKVKITIKQRTCEIYQNLIGKIKIDKLFRVQRFLLNHF